MGNWCLGHIYNRRVFLFCASQQTYFSCSYFKKFCLPKFKMVTKKGDYKLVSKFWGTFFEPFHALLAWMILKMLAQVFGPKISYGYLKCKSAVLCKLPKNWKKLKNVTKKAINYKAKTIKKAKFHIIKFYVYNSLDELLPTFWKV